MKAEHKVLEIIDRKTREGEKFYRKDVIEEAGISKQWFYDIVKKHPHINELFSRDFRTYDNAKQETLDKVLPVAEKLYREDPQGFTYQEVSKLSGVSKTVVSGILKGYEQFSEYSQKNRSKKQSIENAIKKLKSQKSEGFYMKDICEKANASYATVLAYLHENPEVRQFILRDTRYTQRKPGTNEKSILKAAEEFYEERGEPLILSEIARKSKVTVPTVLKYLQKDSKFSKMKRGVRGLSVSDA